MERKNIKVRKTLKIGLKWGTHTEKMKKFLDERHKYTQGNFTNMFQHSQRSLSIRRE